MWLVKQNYIYINGYQACRENGKRHDTTRHDTAYGKTFEGRFHACAFLVLLVTDIYTFHLCRDEPHFLRVALINEVSPLGKVRLQVWCERK